MMTRQCGTCTLCCTLLPVRGVTKAGERCKFQRFHKGCSVYHQHAKGFPVECGIWSCAWLGGDGGETSRPDRAGFVIDVLPDFVEASNDGVTEKIPVVQVWVDPRRPDSHRDPALRAWLDSLNRCALIRQSDREAFLLIPPSANSRGEWIEHHSNVIGPTHTAAQVLDVIGEF